MASFAIEPAFWELFPQAEIGIVVARGIDNAHESSEDVKAALAEANKAALAHVPDPTISKNPAVAVWREAFQQFKTKKGARSSIEALLKRASGGREVGSINPLVDIYNTVSLTYALPCGGEDIDTFAGDLRLTVTRSARWATRPIPRRCRARCATSTTPARCAVAGTGATACAPCSPRARRTRSSSWNPSTRRATTTSQRPSTILRPAPRRPSAARWNPIS